MSLNFLSSMPFKPPALTYQSRRKRAVIIPRITPIPFAKKSAHSARRPNKCCANSIAPPKNIAPKNNHNIDLGDAKERGKTRQKNAIKWYTLSALKGPIDPRSCMGTKNRIVIIITNTIINMIKKVFSLNL